MDNNNLNNENNINSEAEVESSEINEPEETAAIDTHIAHLEQKNAELNDLYVRAQAELQNIQRRSNDEVKKVRDYSISNFAKDMIIVKDYLEMALKDPSGNLETIKTGVDLTLKQLAQIFERQRIKEICPKPKDKLDPHLHQAITTVEGDGAEPNTITDVMQKGYALNERILRPAIVKVTK